MIEETPRPSATVALIRRNNNRLESFLVRRHARTAFGNAWAFPGGAVDASDARVHHACHGLDAAVANRLLDTPNALNYYSAAVRELFEETGVLLAEDTTKVSEDARDGLNSGALGWDELVRAASLKLDCAALHYFSFWITPRGVERRFATRFFVAELPQDQVAEHCGGELVDCRWMEPSAAVALHRSGEMPMILPTVTSLEFLAAFHSVPDALAEADRLAADGIVETLPRAIEVEGRPIIVLPGDPRYVDDIS